MSSNHYPKIPIVNRIVAIILSLVFIAMLILAFFSLPVELVFFNPNQYLALLEQDEYQAILPDIVSDIVISQIIPESSDSQMQSNIFQDATIKTIIKSTLPEEWVQTAFSSSIKQIFDFINFRTPYNAVEIELGELKNHYNSISDVVAERIFESLPNCTGEDLELFSSAGADLQLASIPFCKPPEVFQKPVVQIIQGVFEDSIKDLPENVKISGIIPIKSPGQEALFNQYSLVRWSLRLLPILAIVLFISIAILLRHDRFQMLRWCGRLLILISIVMLVFLTFLLIGFDQFIAMVTNRYLANVIPGFGNLLLKMSQDIGYQTLIWVILSVILVMGLGGLLLLSAKWVKPKPEEPENSQLIEVETATELAEEEISPLPENKQILPDTLEEIEEEEKKNKNKK